LKKLYPVNNVISEANSYLAFPEVEEVHIRESLGRYAAKKIVSKLCLPPRPKSTVDGYAVKHEDVLAASASAPVLLKVKGSVRAGETPTFRLEHSEACWIETGAFLPEGANAVIPVENVLPRNSEIAVFSSAAKYENVSLPGEEYRHGLVIVDRGWRITHIHLAALKLEGYTHISVYKPDARILVTGDEFLRKVSPFPPFTQELVAGWLEEHGIKVREVSFSSDDVNEIIKWLKASDAYITVVMGGTSMGKHDYSVKAIRQLNPEYLVHGVAIRPGKTACIAVKNGRLYAAISGLPVAALSNLELLFKPLLRRAGLNLPEWPRVRGKLTRRVTIKAGLRGFVRVKVYRRRGELFVEPLMLGGSGALASLLEGNGYLVIPEDLEGYDIGEDVEVRLYGSLL